MQTYQADIGCWNFGKQVEVKGINIDEAISTAWDLLCQDLELCKRVQDSGETPFVVQLKNNGNIVWDFCMP